MEITKNFVIDAVYQVSVTAVKYDVLQIAL